MTRASIAPRSRPADIRRRPWPLGWAWAAASDRRGFTLIEVLIAMAVLTIALVAIAGMFPTGYRQVTDAGRMTLAATAGRQILEDVRSVPFGPMLNALDGFDSDDPGTLPAGGPERDVACRWRFALTGATDGCAFTPEEVYSPFGGRVEVTVQTPPPPPLPSSLTLSLVTVKVSVPALTQTVTLTTVIASM